ncbi:response regulator transcription factor [Nocardioides guangzhouensis]|uniref:Response regulator transcription factor n=1 Tax=Nocardioides guangzhouensis TaxID=2497878 RepID=A0A4Q4ZGG5_9ACTN|nr:response regulator transcription factor [Nocardioides guangzhouensis]RYP87277.1 response regulator transcription factor [Nocardioides guangzhouensis]
MRLVLADDHLMLLEALALALTARGHDVVGRATTPEHAVRLVRRFAPDLCLLDVHFPGGSGLAAIRPILEASARTRVVMFSGWREAHTVERARVEGATGFVSKEQPLAEVLDDLERAGRGTPIHVPAPRTAATGGETDRDDPLWQLRFLTDREWQVMRCILDGLTTAEMAEAMGVRRNTARTHVQNLLGKLGVHSRLRAAALVSAHATDDTWPAHLREPGSGRVPVLDEPGSAPAGGAAVGT